MKTTSFFIVLLLLLTSCKKDPYYESETNEHFVILKDEITGIPNTPVQFYWIQGRIDSLKHATTCLSTDVKFEKPYLVANGVKFHVYRWQSTQYRYDNKSREISRMELTFYPE